MKAPDVIGSIEHAFAGLPRPDISLRQFRLTDRIGLGDSITFDEWEAVGSNRVDSQWQDIPDAEIEECGVVLAHMRAAAFRYYLPAYMRYAVIRSQLPLSKSEIVHMTVFSLNPTSTTPGVQKYFLSQLSLFTHAQREAVALFLHCIAENADSVLQPYVTAAVIRWTEPRAQDGFDVSEHT